MFLWAIFAANLKVLAQREKNENNEIVRHVCNVIKSKNTECIPKAARDRMCKNFTKSQVEKKLNSSAPAQQNGRSDLFT